MSRAQQTLVRRAVEEVWNRVQLDAADELFAPGYLNHGGLITDLVRGPEAIKASVVLLRRAFPGLQITIEALAGEGEITVLSWRARDTASALASRTGGLTGVTCVRAAAGQIQESWTTWDRAAGDASV